MTPLIGQVRFDGLLWDDQRSVWFANFKWVEVPPPVDGIAILPDSPLTIGPLEKNALEQLIEGNLYDVR